MADLRRFQTRSQTQANLSQVPPAQPTASPALALAGVATQLAPTIVGAVSSARQAEAEAAQATQLGQFTTALANAQQRGQTDPRFNVQQSQRKLFQEAVAASPELSGELIKVFTDATGIKPAGLSAEQKAEQDFQSEAWAAGFGSALATPEENLRQVDLYRRIKNLTGLMDFSTRTQEFNKENEKTETYNYTAQLASVKTESLGVTLDGIINSISNGGSRAEAELAWSKLKVQWSNEIAQFGEFANDPVIKAQLSGIQTLFETGDRFIRGEADLNEAQKATQIAVEKQKAMVASDPEDAFFIAVSELYGHNPGLTSVTYNAVQALLKRGPSDIRDLSGQSKADLNGTLENMGQSDNPNAQEEAALHVKTIAEHLDRNGMDYTDDNILEVCSVMAAPAAFKEMDANGKRVVASACEVYAADVAGKAIRDIEQSGSISIPTETVTPRGTTQFGEPRVLPVEEFATMEVNENGMAYVATPEYRNNRQVQRQIQNLNRSLDKVNPVAQVYASATGLSTSEVAKRLWGIGAETAAESAGPVIVRPRETTPSDQVNPTTPPVTREEFRSQFIDSAVGAGASEDEAIALWEQVNTPAVETVEDTAQVIGDAVLTEEEAEELLSNPVQQ